jgi:AbiV family abortive infection protein
MEAVWRHSLTPAWDAASDRPQPRCTDRKASGCVFVFRSGTIRGQFRIACRRKHLTGSKTRTKRRLNQYSGKLTAEKVADGMNAAIQNATRLAADARLLFDNGRYASAMALAILAIEEVGKVAILRGLAVASEETALKSGWRDYRTHTKKNVMWPLIFELKSGARCATDFAKLFDDNAEHPQLLENVKQVCFYTDCLSDCNWSVPEKIIERDLAQVILQAAEVMARVQHITTDEIELWIEYLKPHWNQSDEARAAALFAWHEEMKRRGLAKGEVTMEQFFREGFPDPRKS